MDDSAFPSGAFPSGASRPVERPARRPRDLRIDAARGAALLTILISHAPNNPLAQLTLGRFGLSDAADVFVFLAGVGAALAFGPAFLHGRSILPGVAAVVQRIFVLWRTHLFLFATVLALCLWANLAGFHAETDYVRELNLGFVLDNPGPALLGLMSLGYVPNYFDILPLYIVLMAMVPGFLYLGRHSPGLAVGASVAIYGAAQIFQLTLPAEIVSARPWFFNPFGWQLLFFTGMALTLGWLRMPAIEPRLLRLATVMLGVGFVLGFAPLREAVPGLHEAYEALLPWFDKSNFGVMRWVHFLSLALVAVAWMRAHASALQSPVAKLLATCGSQSLPCFVAAMLMSRAMGMGFDLLEDGPLTVIAINVTAVLALLAVGQLSAWMAGKPWKTVAAATASVPGALPAATAAGAAAPPAPVREPGGAEALGVTSR